MKYNPGDPVWAFSDGSRFPAGEYAGIVIGPTEGGEVLLADYRIDIPSLPPPKGDGWLLCQNRLRPRRDDYQQHEPLGSMDKIDSTSDLNEAELERIYESA